MDYEKAYKAVLETATQWIKDGCTDKEKICLESVFPELRESEDERIRKIITDSVFYQYDAGVEYKDVLDYLDKLEKQKEPHYTKRNALFDKCVENCDPEIMKRVSDEVDLDADIEMEWDSFNKHLAEYGKESEEVVWLNWNSFNDVTRHFYELGKNSK